MSLQYIIDGYNITNHPHFSQKINKKYYDSRVALVQLIITRRLCGSPNNRAWVIFDGYPDSAVRDLSAENICVIFSRKSDADSRIKKLVELISNPKNTLVVSDDKEIIFFVKSCGAKTVSVKDFLKTKDREQKAREAGPETEIGYSDMHKINEELRKLWLS